jgi:hypothetical protein
MFYDHLMPSLLALNHLLKLAKDIIHVILKVVNF